MPFQERVQLARALAERYGHRLNEVHNWRPLIEFTRGNPLTITILVAQALRDRLNTYVQIQQYLRELRSNETAFRDEPVEGLADIRI
jgi:hypothetical protein